jgi:uncharacterized protein YndB with AHSA1/START domain
VYEAFTDPDQFARWYGPLGFPVTRDTVELDARVGGRQRFVMVSDADPAMRTAFDGQFTEVAENVRLASSGTWDGIPGQAAPWPSNLRVDLHHADGKTRVVLREGPQPAGTADLGRQAWEMMFAKLESVLRDRRDACCLFAPASPGQANWNEHSGGADEAAVLDWPAMTPSRSSPNPATVGQRALPSPNDDARTHVTPVVSGSVPFGTS